MKFITIEQKLKDLLSNPDLFFSEKLKTEFSLKYPIFIILVYSIISASINSFALRGRSLSYLYEHTIVNIYEGWIFLSIIFYLTSLVFKSDGSFKRTLEFISYGLVPGIFAGIVNLIVHFILRNSFNLSPINPLLAVKYQLQLIIHNPLLQASTIFGFCCFLWTVYIWEFAISYALNMSKRKAIITVIITVSVPYIIIYIFILIGLY